MATAVRGLWSAALRQQCRAAGAGSIRQLPPRSIGGQRFISATSRVWDDAKKTDANTQQNATPKGSKAKEEPKFDEEEEIQRSVAHLEQRLKDELSTPEIAAMLAPDTDDLADAVKGINDVINEMSAHITPHIKRPIGYKMAPGLMAEGEDKADGVWSDPDFEEDDISSLAHAELEQHRELRQYARITAWEMPMLSKLATKYSPPTTSQILRFRYTSYMGEEHPAEKKVVVEFCPAEIPGLSKEQVEKLIKLLGVRYNPETRVAKISCESFETQAQNKRYLGELIDKLVKEAKDATDMFKDIPHDFRHYESKLSKNPKPKFPKSWRVTTRRREFLAQEREKAALRDQQAEAEGRLLDGTQVIAQGVAYNSIPDVVMVNAGTSSGAAKVPKLTVRR